MPRKKKGYQSGFYTTKKGNPFHALVDNASQETMDAIASLVDSVQHSLGKSCPTCGNHWLHGLEFNAYNDPPWKCECGWSGNEPLPPAEAESKNSSA